MKYALIMSVLTLNLQPAHAKHQSGLCMRKFLNTRDQIQDASGFTTYLQLLIQNQTLQTKDLTVFMSALKENKLINPIQNKDTHKKYKIAHDEFQELLNSGFVDLKKVQSWANDFLVQSETTTRQQENSKQQSKEVPFLITDSGAMFYKFQHPKLGEAVKILKAGGRYEIQADWEEFVWAVNAQKGKFTNDEGVDATSMRLVSRESHARKACMDLEGSSDLPTRVLFNVLLKYFDHSVDENKNIKLTDRGFIQFGKVFPDAIGHLFWTSSVGTLSPRQAWNFNGIHGRLDSFLRHHFASVRCVAIKVNLLGI